MNNRQNPLTSLSDDELLTELLRLAARERSADCASDRCARGKWNARRLYLGQGCSSLFVYCTRVLRLSEHAAYGRIEAARAARRFPVLLEVLESGELTLTSICLLVPLLTDANHRDVLARARHRTKREVEEIVASLRPRPDVQTMVRRLPDRPVPQTRQAGEVLSIPAPAPSVQNIELRCRAHNQYEADLFFGDPLIVRERPAPYLSEVHDRRRRLARATPSAHECRNGCSNSAIRERVRGLRRGRELESAQRLLAPERGHRDQELKIGPDGIRETRVGHHLLTLLLRHLVEGAACGGHS